MEIFITILIVIGGFTVATLIWLGSPEAAEWKARRRFARQMKLDAERHEQEAFVSLSGKHHMSESTASKQPES